MSASSRVRVLIVDPDPSIRTALHELLVSEFDVVGALFDGELLLDAVQELCPDVILLDVAMPMVNGFDAARRVLASCPDVKIIFFTNHVNPEYVAEATAVGARGYLGKTQVGEDILRAIRCVHGGRKFFAAV